MTHFWVSHMTRMYAFEWGARLNESLVTHLNESCSQSTETRAKNVTPKSLVSVDSSLLYQQIGTHHVSRFTLLRVNTLFVRRRIRLLSFDLGWFAFQCAGASKNNSFLLLCVQPAQYTLLLYFRLYIFLRLMFEGRLWNFGGTHKIHKSFLTESTGSTWVGKEQRDNVESVHTHLFWWTLIIWK